VSAARTRSPRSYAVPIALAGVLLLAGAGGAFWKTREPGRQLRRAKAALERRYPATAAHQLSGIPYEVIARLPEGCRVLTASLLESGEVGPLLRAAETCHQAGVKDPILFLAWGQALEARTLAAPALAAYNDGLAAFPNSGELHFRRATLLDRSGLRKEALRGLEAAVVGDQPAAPWMPSAIQMLSDGLEAARARELLPTLTRPSESFSNDGRLTLARGLLKHGLKEDATRLVSFTIGVLDSNVPVPKRERDRLLEQYADIFKLVPEFMLRGESKSGTNDPRRSSAAREIRSEANRR
jgi:tetratricopeptide (TPR) repeat protein